MVNARGPKSHRLVLAAVALGLAAVHIVWAFSWTTSDKTPPHWDPAVHLGTALDYKEAFAQGRWLDMLLTQPRPGHPQYPPSYHYSLIPLLSLEHPHTAAAWLNLIYLALLVGACGRMAFRLGGAFPAAAAMIVLALSPRMIHVFREPFPDLALTAWVALAYCLILESELFRKRPASLAAGFCAGLALLSKWGAVIYLFPALLTGLSDKTARKNTAAAVVWALTLCAPWYLVNALPMIPRIWASVTLGHHQGNPLTWTWTNWVYYPRYLVECYSWGLALMLAGAVLALKKRTNAPGARSERWLLASWMGFSTLFCTLVPSKDPRYILPAAAAFPALGLAFLPAPALAASAAIALFHARTHRRPEPGDWRGREILEAVERRRAPGNPASLCLLANHRAMNPTTFTWLARHAGLKDVFIGGTQSEIPEWSDFVLVKTGDPGVLLGEKTLRILDDINARRGLFSKVFEAAESFDLPDGSQAVLYAIRPDYPRPARTQRYAELMVKNARLKDVRLDELKPGHYSITASQITIEKLPAPIRDVRVELSGARLALSEGKIYVLGVQSVRLLSARLSWEDLGAALKSRSGFPVRLGQDNGGFKLEASSALPFEVAVGVRLEGSEVLMDLRSLRLAGIRLPGGWHYSRALAAKPPYQPYDLGFDVLRLTKEGLAIGA